MSKQFCWMDSPLHSVGGSPVVLFLWPSGGIRVGFSCLSGEIMPQLNHAYQGRP